MMMSTDPNLENNNNSSHHQREVFQKIFKHCIDDDSTSLTTEEDNIWTQFKNSHPGAVNTIQKNLCGKSLTAEQIKQLVELDFMSFQAGEELWNLVRDEWKVVEKYDKTLSPAIKDLQTFVFNNLARPVVECFANQSRNCVQILGENNNHKNNNKNRFRTDDDDDDDDDVSSSSSSSRQRQVYQKLFKHCIDSSSSKLGTEESYLWTRFKNEYPSKVNTIQKNLSDKNLTPEQIEELANLDFVGDGVNSSEELVTLLVVKWKVVEEPDKNLRPAIIELQTFVFNNLARPVVECFDKQSNRVQLQSSFKSIS